MRKVRKCKSGEAEKKSEHSANLIDVGNKIRAPHIFAFGLREQGRHKNVKSTRFCIQALLHECSRMLHLFPARTSFRVIAG